MSREHAFRDALGRVVTLEVVRFGPPGAFLGSGKNERDVVLLPGAEVPEGLQVGAALEVFVYLDSEDRPVATVRKPRLERDDVTFLEVRDVTRFGAFVDWGLPKELLVPLAEQTRPVNVGEVHPIGLYVDDSGRLAGTMRVSEMLETGQAEFRVDEWVQGEAWRNEPGIGVFVIVEQGHVGLVPESEPHNLRRGASARFRVTNILADGKIELSLRGHAHEELEKDAAHVLSTLTRRADLRIGDKSSPEEIREAFGLSKKAFKRAAGRLLKDGAARIDDAGIVVIAPARRDRR